MSSKSLPRSAADKKLGLKHLKATIALEKQKIADHHKAAKAAKKSGDSFSHKYNNDHLKEHKKDVKERQKTIKKYNKLQFKTVKKARG